MASLRILILFASLIPMMSFAQASSDADAASAGTSESNVPQVNEINAQAKNFGSMAATVSQAAAKLNESVPSCESKKSISDTICLEKTNPGIAQFVAENGEVINMGMMVGSSLGEQCGGISSLLNKAGIVLGAYQATCRTAISVCTSSCAKVQGDVTHVKTASHEASVTLSKRMMSICEKDINPAGGPGPSCIAAQQESANGHAADVAIQSSLATIKVGTSKKEVVCNKYKMSVETAMLGAMNALKGMMQSKQCEKQNKNGEVAALDCTKTESPSYSSPNCQCARGEKSAAECQGINVNANSIKAATIALPNMNTASTGSKSALPGTLDVGGDTPTIGPQSANGAGAPVGGGGGSGASGGGGGGNGAGQDGGGGSSKKLNTNILGGGFGGGGGGGGGSSGPGYDMDSKLKDYMPGGKNDPNRTIASQLAKEVTPQAGRTNWEKVKLRYRDNYSSLLNK